jgi:hypothetical protein
VGGQDQPGECDSTPRFSHLCSKIMHRRALHPSPQEVESLQAEAELKVGAALVVMEATIRDTADVEKKEAIEAGVRDPLQEATLAQQAVRKVRPTPYRL